MFMRYNITKSTMHISQHSRSTCRLMFTNGSRTPMSKTRQDTGLNEMPSLKIFFAAKYTRGRPRILVKRGSLWITKKTYLCGPYAIFKPSAVVCDRSTERLDAIAQLNVNQNDSTPSLELTSLRTSFQHCLSKQAPKVILINLFPHELARTQE